MSGLVTNNLNTATRGYEPVYDTGTNYDYLDMDRASSMRENPFKLHQFLEKIETLSLDILSQRNKFIQLKDGYDPTSKQWSDYATLASNLKKIQDHYQSFSKRKFDIIEEYGRISFDLEQEALFRSSLKKINKQMVFFDHVTRLHSQASMHCDSLLFAKHNYWEPCKIRWPCL